MALGQGIKLARRVRGWTHLDAAASVGVSPRTWLVWEDGKAPPTEEMLCEVEKWLGASRDLLAALGAAVEAGVIVVDPARPRRSSE